eukprot:c158_g1_i1.p1 GENE.c158_g1_i1~~c158_g1_i1.p1  ORF type:complete len:365 (+),score=37.55 c158_g1_i1:485-1579(+)
MTFPTKALCPLLLEDLRKVMVERMGDTQFFTSEHINQCMKKVIAVSLHETIVDQGMEIKAYYAGHVLGAAMFSVRVGKESVVYTGDFNTTADRHLGCAWIDGVKPNVLITESTYATTLRDSRRYREREFLAAVHQCVSSGGKVLIPVFALGRAQELCLLLDSYWHQCGLTVPIYFSSGLAQRANEYYRLFISWTNENIQRTYEKDRNMFEFANIRSFDLEVANQTGAMVLFATPGMLHAGMSLEVFKLWAPDSKNLILIPGYCVKGTVGAKLLSHTKGWMEIDQNTKVDVQCQVRYMSFSAHADAKGISEIVKRCSPRAVVLVHGEKEKMGFLQQHIAEDLKIPTFCPANGVTIRIATSSAIQE